MDAVALIKTALAAGAGAGMNATATEAVKDAYAGLKALVLRRGKATLAGEVTVAEHEKDPETWSAPLAKILFSAGADRDEEVIAAAQRLLQWLDSDGPAVAPTTSPPAGTGWWPFTPS